MAESGLTFDIESPANPRIRALARLADRRHRDAEGLFVVEGPRLVGRAVAAGLEPVTVYLDGSVPFDHADAVTVRPDVLDRVSYRKKSEGVIAVFRQHQTSLAELEISGIPLLVALEGLEKPGNLGAILRTADAVGAGAVVDIGGRIDRFNPNLLRSSTGACFSVPVVHSDLEQFASWARDEGIRIVAADPGARTPLWDADLGGSVAILVGAEDQGLSPSAIAAADSTVHLPMSGVVDSLNASVTVAVVAFEVVRRRSA